MSRAWKERPISTFLATGCGIGMIPFAPGTWGSVEGLGLGFLALRVLWPAASPAAGFLISCIIGLVVGALGVVVGTPVETLVGVRDPGPIVIDEVAGQILAVAPASFLRPGLASGVIPWWLVFGAPFLLFRLFDIWKPGPIRKLQRLPGGWGIVADDVAAGIVAGAITYGIGRAW